MASRLIYYRRFWNWSTETKTEIFISPNLSRNKKKKEKGRTLIKVSAVEERGGGGGKFANQTYRKRGNLENHFGLETHLFSDAADLIFFLFLILLAASLLKKKKKNVKNKKFHFRTKRVKGKIKIKKNFLWIFPAKSYFITQPVKTGKI